MQINKIQSPSFGRCIIINQSACRFLDRMPDKHITEMFEKAASIQDTNYWDLCLKGHTELRQVYLYFVNKQKPYETSFVNELIPVKQEGKTLKAIGKNADLYSNSNISLNLNFDSEERAKEVYSFLNQPKPKSDIDIFGRAVETIKILEEASTPKPQKKKLSFFDRLLNWFQK